MARITVYRTARGEQASGVTLYPIAGGLAVRADQLGGFAPAVGDTLSDEAGKRWRVAEVGAASDGMYPLKCEPIEGAK